MMHCTERQPLASCMDARDWGLGLLCVTQKENNKNKTTVCIVRCMFLLYEAHVAWCTGKQGDCPATYMPPLSYWIPFRSNADFPGNLNHSHTNRCLAELTEEWVKSQKMWVHWEIQRQPFDWLWGLKCWKQHLQFLVWFPLSPFSRQLLPFNFLWPLKPTSDFSGEAAKRENCMCNITSFSIILTLIFISSHMSRIRNLNIQ